MCSRWHDVRGQTRLLLVQGVDGGFMDDGLPLLDADTEVSDGPVFIEDWTNWTDSAQQPVLSGRAEKATAAGRGESAQTDSEAHAAHQQVGAGDGAPPLFRIPSIGKPLSAAACVRTMRCVGWERHCRRSGRRLKRGPY